MLNEDGFKQNFQAFVHAQNVDNARAFSLVTCVACIIFIFGNTGPIDAIKYNHIYNYTNVSILFFIIFLSIRFALKIGLDNLLIEKICVWVTIVSSFLFASLLSFMDVVQGSGPIALAVGYLLVSIFFSSRFYIVISMLILSGTSFLFFISMIDGIEIMQYASGLLAIIIFSTLAFIKTERQRRTVFETNRKLANKISELNSALDVKSSFFGHMSHELRTPLNAIIGFSEMLKNEEYFPKDKHKVIEYAEFINSGGNHLLALVNDLLDHNKIATGEVTLSLEPIDVLKLSQDYIDELKPISREKNQTIKFYTQTNRAEITTDKRLFKQILYNVLSNAQKYSPENSTIELKIKEAGNDNFEIVVKDQGKGMSAELIEQIKISTSSSEAHFISNAEGTGLGLIIVCQLLKLLNGTIEFQSEVNSGTAVKLTFPRQFEDPTGKLVLT
ncbi:MAG: HAMP domain-containing histidine kinase [Alphaproteobacteria bacterium]|nr:HAMP domain-containing histidine kinase [Alphaproteobacteria bacterium]HPF45885.1 HAMP domain-containing sensor histidine kinase [Emcibacteraceae bacterium]HRW29484.1 HAMP domain-containing sensor histidine kinase [Emcibacteraceae bacterium]